MIRPQRDTAEGQATSPRPIVVQHWTEELKRLVPVE